MPFVGMFLGSGIYSCSSLQGYLSSADYNRGTNRELARVGLPPIGPSAPDLLAPFTISSAGFTIMLLGCALIALGPLTRRRGSAD